jgi:hypothetical protein
LRLPQEREHSGLGRLSRLDLLRLGLVEVGPVLVEGAGEVVADEDAVPEIEPLSARRRDTARERSSATGIGVDQGLHRLRVLHHGTLAVGVTEPLPNLALRRLPEHQRFRLGAREAPPRAAGGKDDQGRAQEGGYEAPCQVHRVSSPLRVGPSYHDVEQIFAQGGP